MFRSQRPLRLLLPAIVAALAAVPLAPAPAASARPVVAGGAAPVCPAAEGNARFVRFSYLEILNRCPDSRGLAYWTAQLDRGLRRRRFTDIIDMSAENLVRNNVVPLYQFLLGRPPTAAELEADVADIRARRANDAITARLLASDEGYERQVLGTTPAADDAAWLEWAYARILDRSPDPQGVAYFLGRFGPSGSTEAQRYDVAMDLERSESNARSWVKASMTEALGRKPDPAGVAFWMDWLMGRGRWQTFRMWTLHLASDEAYRRAQTQPG